MICTIIEINHRAVATNRKSERKKKPIKREPCELCRVEGAERYNQVFLHRRCA